MPFCQSKIVELAAEKLCAFIEPLKPDGLRVAYIKEDRFFPSVTHPFSLSLCSPSTECLLTGVHSSPGCQLEYPLTFNLWPPEPERHRLTLLSRGYILRTTVMITEGSDGQHRCYRYSSKLLLSLYLQHIQQKEQRNGLWTGPSTPFFSICPDAPGLKRRSCCSSVERCLLQRGSSYNRAARSSLLKKCACCLLLLLQTEQTALLPF